MFQHVRKWIVIFLTILLCHYHHAHETGRSDINSYNEEKSFYHNDDGQDTYHTYSTRDRYDDSHDIEKSDNLNPVPRSRQETGWKPILRSRNLDRDSEALRSLQLQILRARYLEYLNSKTESIPSSTTESHLKWEPRSKITKTWAPKLNTQIHVDKDEKNLLTFATESYHNNGEFDEVKAMKKPKMMKEDDIMWMHYGPPSEDEDYARYRTTRGEKHEKKIATVLPTTTEAFHNHKPHTKTPDWLDYGLQYFFSSYQDEEKLVDKKKPKNIYEVIDKNNHHDFKPMVDLNKRHIKPNSYSAKSHRQNENRKSDHVDRLIKNNDSGDQNSLLDSYKEVYEPDNDTKEREKDMAENEIKSSLENEQQDDSFTSLTPQSKFKPETLASFIDNYQDSEPLSLDYTRKLQHNNEKTEQKYYSEHDQDKPETLKSEKLSDDWWLSSDDIKNTQDRKHDQKSGKFLGKPIVIAESVPEPSLTPEYYRKLFESFGGHEENIKTNLNPKKNLQNNIKHIEHNSTNTSHPSDTENSLDDYFEPLNDINRAAKSYSPNENQNSIANQTQSDKIQNCTTKSERKHRNTSKEKSENSTVSEKINHRESNDESFDIFKIVSFRVKDFMPRTLKTNIFLIKKLLTECYAGYDEENINGSSITCLKKITSRVLDKAIDSDIIKITDTVSLVKENVTKVAIDESSPRSSSSDLAEVEWLPSIMDKIFKLFSTHSLKMQLVNPEDKNSQVEGRRRHHFRRIFPVIAGIYMTITAVMIPLVFQFMAMMGGKSFVVSKIALLVAVLSSVSKFITGASEPAYPHHHHHHPPPPPYPPPVYYDHPPWKKSDKRHKRRRRHYRRVFPIMVGAYMILSTVLIPLGFKFMTLLGTKSLLISKLSLIIALMGGIKKIFGFGAEVVAPPHYSSLYPTAAYPPVYPSYYDPWRRDEFRKISHLDDPTEYSHYSEEIE